MEGLKCLNRSFIDYWSTALSVKLSLSLILSIYWCSWMHRLLLLLHSPFPQPSTVTQIAEAAIYLLKWLCLHTIQDTFKYPFLSKNGPSYSQTHALDSQKELLSFHLKCFCSAFTGGFQSISHPFLGQCLVILPTFMNFRGYWWIPPPFWHPLSGRAKIKREGS